MNKSSLVLVLCQRMKKRVGSSGKLSTVTTNHCILKVIDGNVLHKDLMAVEVTLY